MTKCTDSGCRNLQTTCADCGRVVCTKTFTGPGEWISVKEKDSPPMRDVLLFVNGDIGVGWNESVQPEEIASYCSYQAIDSDEVTHWMPLPKTPEWK
jgi:hypothetical protein